MLETTLGIASLAMLVILYPVYRYYSQVAILKYVDFRKIIPKEKTTW